METKPRFTNNPKDRRIKEKQTALNDFLEKRSIYVNLSKYYKNFERLRKSSLLEKLKREFKNKSGKSESI